MNEERGNEKVANERKKKCVKENDEKYTEKNMDN